MVNITTATEQTINFAISTPSRAIETALRDKIDNKTKPLSPASQILERSSYKNEFSCAQAGLMLHYLQQKNPDAFSRFWPTFVAGKGTSQDLLVACAGKDGKVDTNVLDQDFLAFIETYKKEFKPWDK